MLSWVLCVAGASAAVPFPAEDAWEPMLVGNQPVEDVLDDMLAVDPFDPFTDPSLDLLGIPTSAAVWWYATADTLFLRLQVQDDSEQVDATWGFLLDIDGDPSNFEYAVLITDAEKTLRLVSNVGHTAGTWVFATLPVDVDGYGDAYGRETRAVQTAGRFYVDAQFSLTVLGADIDFEATTPLRLAAFTTPYWTYGLTDVAACDGVPGPCDDLAAVLSDTVVVDEDQDGLGAPEEHGLGTDPADPDTDDDGLPDGLEADDDDGDGTVDALECDTDGDGLADGTESGVVIPTAGTDPAGCFVADLDPGETTHPSDPDTDRGGLSDGREDANRNGAVDAWEVDPNDASDDLDTDGDGVPDVFDDLFGQGADVDSDGDTLLDADEGLGDFDGDDVPDFADLDSDADGIPDAVETSIDTDGDGRGNHVDLDADADTVPDAIETAVDTDGDQLADYRDPDSDGDDIPDEIEGTLDGDGDLLPDRIDPDSDGDGLSDAAEGAGDWDLDLVPDFRDLDSDDDGLPDTLEGSPDSDGDPLDTDRDGDEDFRDLDSDDDGIPDADESEGDVDCDGLVDRLDDDPEDAFCDTGVAPPTIDTDGDPPGGPGSAPNPFAAEGQFTGGSCSVAPGPASGWAAALLLLLWRRRVRVALGLAVLPLGSAMAQTVDAERFGPSVDGGILTTVEDAETAEAGAAGLGLLFDYADDPFVFRPDEGDEIAVLGAVATAHVTGWYSLGSVVVGAEIPVHLFTEGYRVDAPTHLGDVRLYGKIRAVHAGLVSLGPYLDLSLPTGAVDAWVGAGDLVANGGGLFTLASDRWLASAAVGVQNGTGNKFGALVVSPALTWGAGLGLSATDALSFAAEVEAEHWLSNPDLAGDLPIQGLLTTRGRLGDATATLGGGAGLSRGIGAPDFRIVAGIAWAPVRDGSPSASPEITDRAAADEGTPVSSDPADPAALCRLVVRAIDPAGRPVGGAEVRVVGTLGDPLVTGPDGILEARLRPGEIEITVTAPGWTPVSRTVSLSPAAVHDVSLVLAPSEVRIDRQANQIFLVEKVFFEVAKTELLVRSLQALDGLVAVLLANPEIGEIRIEGHTDATGDAAANLALSQGRAESVRTYLIKQGVAPERLRAVGLGETHPLQAGDSEEVYATNRRVEFHIVSLGD